MNNEIEYHDHKKIWLVEHPISQYNENVKLLARQRNLKILDPAWIDVAEEFLEPNPPELTKKASDVKTVGAERKKQKLVKKTDI